MTSKQNRVNVDNETTNIDDFKSNGSYSYTLQTPEIERAKKFPLVQEESA